MNPGQVTGQAQLFHQSLSQRLANHLDRSHCSREIRDLTVTHDLSIGAMMRHKHRGPRADGEAEHNSCENGKTKPVSPERVLEIVGLRTRGTGAICHGITWFQSRLYVLKLAIIPILLLKKITVLTNARLVLFVPEK